MNILLPVEFEHQLNNKKEPHRSCNTSANFMVARYLGAKISSDDEYRKIVDRYGDTTDHAAQGKALSDLGIKSTWSTTATFAQLDASLKQDYPIVCGILHRGNPHVPTGGHMIVVIGRSGDSYVCHDPYGSLLDPGGGYTGDVMNGKAVKYPIWQFIRRWAVPKDGNGWSRFFTQNPLPKK